MEGLPVHTVIITGSAKLFVLFPPGASAGRAGEVGPQKEGGGSCEGPGGQAGEEAGPVGREGEM